MKILNILIGKLNSPNEVAFLYPLIRFRNKLLENGIKINFFSNLNQKNIFECNFFVIDYRYLYDDFEKKLKNLIDILYVQKTNMDKVFFYDNSDSTGTLSNEIFEFVDIYLKNQILKKTSLYSEKFYGARIYTDFYYKKFNIEDNIPLYQVPVEKKNVKKIKVGWNSGLCEYSYVSAYKQTLVKFFKDPSILNIFRFNKNFFRPSLSRTNLLSCRFGENYSRNTVSFQRRLINKKIKKFKITKKINRFSYFKELNNSQVVVSPFGWGEISLRDFEVFITGGLLYKPNMNHLITWPNFFEENKTIKCFSWNLIDFDINLEKILDNYKNFISISEEAQNRYLKYTISEDAFELFFRHLKSILNHN